MEAPSERRGAGGGGRRCSARFFAGTLLILCLWCPGRLVADTIVLKNGARIRHVEVWEDDGLVKCRRFGSVIGYPRGDVLRVMAGPVAPAPPERTRPTPSPPAQDAGVEGRNAPPGASSEDFRLKRVADGDSLEVTDGNLLIRIRIVGIDAPERGYRKKNIPGQPYSRKAADYLEHLVSGRPVRIQGYGSDSYNRQLAEIFAGGRNIGLAMVEAGFAEVYSGKQPEGFDPKPYIAAEKRARKYGQGMWAQGRMYVSPRKWRTAHRR